MRLSGDSLYAPPVATNAAAKMSKLQRKGWFTQLKTQYPEARGRKKLKYYW